MSISERIGFIRNLRGITQKRLGMAIGFSEKTSDVRIAQYESGNRTPRTKMIADIADVLDVCPEAVAIPDIETDIGLMHTLFALEDLYGLKVNNINGELCLTLDRSDGSTFLSMFDKLNAWYKESEKCKNGEISGSEYNAWRYNYPESEAKRVKAALNNIYVARRRLPDTLSFNDKDKSAT